MHQQKLLSTGIGFFYCLRGSLVTNILWSLLLILIFQITAGVVRYYWLLWLTIKLSMMMPNVYNRVFYAWIQSGVFLGGFICNFMLCCLFQISPIQSLVGQTGRRWVMGVISQLEDGHFYLEDLTASVEINLSNAISFFFIWPNIILFYLKSSISLLKVLRFCWGWNNKKWVLKWGWLQPVEYSPLIVNVITSLGIFFDWNVPIQCLIWLLATCFPSQLCWVGYIQIMGVVYALVVR